MSESNYKQCCRPVAKIPNANPSPRSKTKTEQERKEQIANSTRTTKIATGHPEGWFAYYGSGQP